VKRTIARSRSQRARFGKSSKIWVSSRTLGVVSLGESQEATPFCSRSWTGKKHYILAVKPGDGSSGVEIEAITWEQDKGGIHISEEQGKKEAVILCRALLGCDFDKLPHYDISLLVG